jgi:hypothetical protein
MVFPTADFCGHFLHTLLVSCNNQDPDLNGRLSKREKPSLMWKIIIIFFSINNDILRIRLIPAYSQQHPAESAAWF